MSDKNDATTDNSEYIYPAEKQLKEYVHTFLASGQNVHVKYNYEYSLIDIALNEEIRSLQGERLHIDHLSNTLTNAILKSLGLKEPEASYINNYAEEQFIDIKTKYYYRFALNDEIAKFYFLHFPTQYLMRKDLISACVKMGDVNRANILIDMMKTTKDNEDYQTPYGWGYLNMLSIRYLIDEYAYEDTRLFNSMDISDNMRKIVKQLVYEILPFLPQKAVDQLMETSSHKIESLSENIRESKTEERQVIQKKESIEDSQNAQNSKLRILLGEKADTEILYYIDDEGHLFKIIVDDTLESEDAEIYRSIEEYEEDDEYNGITIYEEDDILVSFWYIDFDAHFEKLTLSIWCENLQDTNIEFWLKEVTVNGIIHATSEFLAERQDDFDYASYQLYDVNSIDYKDIKNIVFQVEINDENANTVGVSKIVKIQIDTNKEEYKVALR